MKSGSRRMGFRSTTGANVTSKILLVQYHLHSPTCASGVERQHSVHPLARLLWPVGQDGTAMEKKGNGTVWSDGMERCHKGHALGKSCIQKLGRQNAAKARDWAHTFLTAFIVHNPPIAECREGQKSRIAQTAYTTATGQYTGMC